MTIRIAINGFGRIGRNIFRAVHELGRKDINIIAINDLAPIETNAYLLKYDSIHGPFPGTVSIQGNKLKTELGSISVLSERDPKKLPWKELGIDVALECTGIFSKRIDAEKHLSAGARKVLISAPGENADFTIVNGVNHKNLSADDVIVSNASCTTNCLAPVASVLHQTFGIEHGFMTTVHAYTLDQSILDTMHKDLRRARAAASSMIPTSTGAARAVGLVLPELKGKLDGTAIRVPTSNVSMIDLTVVTDKPTTIKEINSCMKNAADGSLKNILSYMDEPLVSVDFNHNPASSIFDASGTVVINGTFCRILSWYDNEWGFSNRMVDVASMLGKL